MMRQTFEKPKLVGLLLLAWAATGCGGQSKPVHKDGQVPDNDGGRDGGGWSDALSEGDGGLSADASMLLDSGMDGGQTCRGTQILQYGVAEVTLQASRMYDGTSGSPNPFDDVDVTATVTTPDNRTIEVEGFFDGDGTGGNNGNVFKIRVFADSPGRWNYITHSAADSGLDGLTGHFCVEGILPGRFASGPVLVNPSNPHSFMLADGSPIYLIGKFLDMAAPDPIKFSHTMFSELLTDADRQAMLDRHVAMGLNKINVYLANKGDYHSVSTTPWLGNASNNDKSHFDLSRWHMYEHWVETIRDAGLVAQLWFFADDSNFGALPDQDKQRLMRYAMARLSAYANTMFTLCLEWQEGWSAQAVNRNGAFLQQHNPWKRLVSVHGTTGDFAFADQTWADYMDIQSGNDADYTTVHAMGLANRNLADKPLINEEFGLGDETDELRRRAWSAFTAGAGGSGTGAFLQHLAAFTELVPFERMSPHDELVTSHNAYCLAAPGSDYVVYLPQGGQVSVDLTPVSGSLNVTWFDPRTGSRSNGGQVTAGSVQTFTPPAGGDFALFLHKP